MNGVSRTCRILLVLSFMAMALAVLVTQCSLRDGAVENPSGLGDAGVGREEREEPDEGGSLSTDTESGEATDLFELTDIERVLDPTIVSLMGEGVTKRVVSSCLVDAAQDALERYESQGSCVLADAGYIDLLGNAWACTVVGDGWVDVVIVREIATKGETEVITVRMDAQELERELVENGVRPDEVGRGGGDL